MELTNGESFWRKHFSADEQCKYFISLNINLSAEFTTAQSWKSIGT
jgi:hypothetical protein